MPMNDKVPSPLDSPTLADPLECPPLRWGLIGCGRVSHDFCQALQHLPTARVVACATARDVNRAKEFATKHGIDTAYGTYEELVQDPNVDICYVGNVHAFRLQVGELCLNAGKHTLLEKPLACTVEEAQRLIQLAREKNVFLMEGMWTRFFPAVEQARKVAFGEDGNGGIIGQVTAVFSDFNFNASDSEEYPTSFVYNRKLGGGASLLTGPYPIAAALLFFPGATPDQIKVVGQVDETTGVDLQACISMSFPPTSNVAPAVDDTNTEENTPKLPGTGVANLSYGMLCESVEETTVVGTKGRLTIQSPAHCPTKLVVTLKGDGRGAAVGQMVYEYPLPVDTEAIAAAGGYFYPNSAGFCYEAAAVARCIAAGKLEAPQYTLDETLKVMKILEQTRLQLGTKKVSDD